MEAELILKDQGSQRFGSPILGKNGIFPKKGIKGNLIYY